MDTELTVSSRIRLSVDVCGQNTHKGTLSCCRRRSFRCYLSSGSIRSMDDLKVVPVKVYTLQE